MPLYEGHGAHRLDEVPQTAPKGPDGLRLSQCDGTFYDLGAQLGFDLVDEVYEDLGMLLGDSPAGERVECGRVPLHQRLSLHDQPACGILGDPHRRCQFQSNRPLRRCPGLPRHERSPQ